MEFEKLAKERYSVRKFVQKHVDKSDIDKILEIAHAAPTGCNIQPQRILLLNTDESVEKLKDCTKCHFDAPCAMIVCCNMDETWTRKFDGAKSAPVDAAIVTTHIMLAAHDIGVGSCWVMYFEPDKLRKAYNIPDSYEPVAILVMGYPAPDAKVDPCHDKKRPMDEVVFYDTF